jgi:hypothetical protein
MLRKRDFLLNNFLCNRQSDLTRLGITVNRFDRLQSDLTNQ